ncbi:MAG: hypothetical protein IH897_09720, partial [Planctomycetes bacterium]|nr:hypothetical protein [Planctomycetota bacterium]
MASHTTISAIRLPAVLTVLFATSMASGFGWHCPPYGSSVTDADTIVIGRTIRVTTEEFRPTLYAVTYEFHVDQVLKGDMYGVGETIVRRYEFLAFGFQPFPGKDEGPHLVFVNRADDGKEYFGCTASVADVDLDGIRRQIKVQDDPPAFFNSDDEQHVTIVLAWIRRTYVRHEPNGGWHADWSDQSLPNRETIIRYLLKHARGKNDDLCVSALDVLASIHAPEAFGTFKTALQSTNDGDKISHAARGLGKLGDERAIPLLFDRWTELREQNAERERRSQAGEDTVNVKLRSRGRLVTPHQRAPEDAVFAALISLDDPRATQALLDSLSGTSSWQTMVYMRQLNDPRAVEPLLRSLWQGNHSAIEQLAKYDDERITEEARERLYDHPMAPRLLAARGDPSARASMTRRLR